MPRKRTEFKLIEINKPDPMSLPLSIGLNLPCIKGCYDTDDRDEDDSDLGELGVKNQPLTED